MVDCNACNFVVLSSVQLDRESTFDAVEVDDVWRNGMLPSKAKA
jgi:hypothetical protein